MIFLQKLAVDTRFIIKPLQIRLRDQVRQIAIACFVFYQKHQMIGRIIATYFVKAAFGRDIDLTADDRLNTGLFANFIKIHHPVHHAVIGNR